MAGGGIFATTAVSLAAFGFSIATFVWSRRIKHEIDTYPYGDVIELPREVAVGLPRGRGITDHHRTRTVAQDHGSHSMNETGL